MAIECLNILKFGETTKTDEEEEMPDMFDNYLTDNSKFNFNKMVHFFKAEVAKFVKSAEVWSSRTKPESKPVSKPKNLL